MFSFVILARGPLLKPSSPIIPEQYKTFLEIFISTQILSQPTGYITIYPNNLAGKKRSFPY